MGLHCFLRLPSEDRDVENGLPMIGLHVADSGFSFLQDTNHEEHGEKKKTPNTEIKEKPNKGQLSRQTLNNYETSKSKR